MKIMGFVKVGNKHIWVDADFKEAEHPRAKNGQFGSKGSGEGAKSKEKSSSGPQPSSAPGKQLYLPKALKVQALTLHAQGGKNKSIGGMCQTLLASGGWSNESIAAAAQHVFGSKTSPASVAWYKMQAKKETKEGKAEIKKKEKGQTANNAKIAKAVKTPMPDPELEKKLTEAEKTGYKAVFVKATNAFGKTQFVKLSGVPQDLDQVSIDSILKSKGLSVVSTSAWSNSKTPPPNCKAVTMTDSEVAIAKEKALKKAATEAAKHKPVTEFEEKLDPHMKKAVQHYSNGSYESLNATLRSATPMSTEQANLAARLDAAINRSKATENFTVYRGCAKPQKFFGPKPTIGTICIDNGYISTSKSSDTAQCFSFGSRAMIAKIKVAKGCRALDISNLSYHPEESEVVLPRGAMFIITAINGDTVECDYVCG